MNGEEMQLYTSVPSGSSPFVGGLDEFDRVISERPADEGYVAVVPNLFHRFTSEVWPSWTD